MLNHVMNFYVDFDQNRWKQLKTTDGNLRTRATGCTSGVSIGNSKNNDICFVACSGDSDNFGGGRFHYLCGNAHYPVAGV